MFQNVDFVVVSTDQEPNPVEKPGRASQTRKRVIVVTSMAHFFNDGIIFFVPVIGDLLAKDHGSSAVIITTLLTLFYLSSAALGVVVGLVADSIGRRGLMMALGIGILAVSLFGFFTALQISGRTASDVMILLAALLAGLGSSFYHPLGGSLLQLGFAEHGSGRALGINGAFGSLGRAAYPALFFVVAALGISQADTVAVFGGLAILAAFLVVASLGKKHVGIEDHSTSVHAPRQPLRSLFTRSVITLMLISFFRSLAFIGIVSWVPIYLTTQRHAGTSTALGWAITVMYAGGIVGQPAFGLLVDRFDKRVVLAIDSLGSAIGIFVFLTTSGSGAAALLSLLLFGFFTFSGFPLLMSLVGDYVPKRSSTTGNALVWGVGSTGGKALGPIVATLLALGEYSHLGFAFGVLGIVAAATVLGTPLLAKPALKAHMQPFG